MNYGVVVNEDDTAVRVWRELRSLVMDRNDRRREVSTTLGMSFAMSKALLVLAGEGPLSLGDIANRLITDPPYATLVVEGLVRRGHVLRTPDPADRRRKLVHLTDSGRAAAATATAIFDTPPEPLRALPEDDLRTLARILAGLNAPDR